MCNYCGTNNYRKIYKNHFGKIPKDADGKSFQIHHIDGNHNNNSPENLKCIAIKEHYDIHYAQGDYGACFYLSKSIRLSAEEISELGRIVALKKLNDGTHPFQDPEVRERGAIAAKLVNDERIKNGTHNFCGGDIQRKATRKRVKDGTHHFLGSTISDKRIADGTHNLVANTHAADQLARGSHTSQIIKKCEYCNIETNPLNYANSHGIRCESNPNKDLSEMNKICEFCNKSFDPVNFKRWHGDNCRLNPVPGTRCLKTCEFCNNSFDAANYSRWHGDKCKLK